jgi:hypothetical protein
MFSRQLACNTMNLSIMPTNMNDYDQLHITTFSGVWKRGLKLNRDHVTYHLTSNKIPCYIKMNHGGRLEDSNKCASRRRVRSCVCGCTVEVKAEDAGLRVHCEGEMAPGDAVQEVLRKFVRGINIHTYYIHIYT